MLHVQVRERGQGAKELERVEGIEVERQVPQPLARTSVEPQAPQPLVRQDECLAVAQRLVAEVMQLLLLIIILNVVPFLLLRLLVYLRLMPSRLWLVGLRLRSVNAGTAAGSQQRQRHCDAESPQRSPGW